MTEKGVIVEYDFTVLDGARILYDTTGKFLEELDGVAFGVSSESRYLQGADLQSGLQALFAAVKTKKTAAKASRDLADALKVALTAAFPKSVTAAFRNFVRALTEKGVRVIVATHADVASESVRSGLADVLGNGVSLYQETSTVYGAVPWKSWRLACAHNHLSRGSALAITGSGDGVRSALLAGMGAVVVENDHVAYHDFGGADAVVQTLDSAAARKVLKLLRA